MSPVATQKSVVVKRMIEERRICVRLLEKPDGRKTDKEKERTTEA